MLKAITAAACLGAPLVLVTGARTFHLHPAAISAALVVIVIGSIVITAALVQSAAPPVVQSRRADGFAVPRVAVRRALIIGAGKVGRNLAESLCAGGTHQVVGFVDEDLTHASHADTGSEPILGTRGEVLALVERHRVQDVFVAYAPTWQQQLAEQLETADPGIRIWVVPTAYEAAMQMGCVEGAGDIALVRLVGDFHRSRERLKRVFDLAAASLGLFLLAPVMLLVALLVRFSSRGPVVFAQERTGRDGNRFMLFKFRTMVEDAEAGTGPMLAQGEKDPRLTKIGRWLRLVRIDEIPQLWNVIRGEMSLVGPRPERPHFVRRYEAMLPSYSKRHRVRPGITGLAQILGGYHTDARDKHRFDLIYASHLSLWLDLEILLRTVGVVLRPRRNSSTNS